MDDDDHSHARGILMNRPTGSIRDLIANPTGRPAAAPPEPPRPVAAAEVMEAEAQPPPKKSDPLPKPGDAYRAHARFLNRLSSDARMIHFVRKDFSCEGYAYDDLRRIRWVPPAEPGGGPVLVLRFVEAVITEVRITGRNLDDLHYWISEGTMPWAWEQPEGFRTRDATVTVITGITIKEEEKR
jgi:hypothetical protein